MPWNPNPATWDPNSGLNVGSANSQDEFYGYGTGLMNPDEIVLDMKERIHLIGADTTPFYSWSSGVRKNGTHNTTFSWIEDELFGHRDFKATLRRVSLGGPDYLYTIRLRGGGDWQAMEAAATADVGVMDPAKRPFIHLQVTEVGGDGAFKFVPLLSGLARGPQNRQYHLDASNYKWLHNELIIWDSRTGGHAGGIDAVNGPETAIYTVPTSFGGNINKFEFGPEVDEIPVFCHTVTPNEALRGFAQGSGLPNESRKRSRSYHNFVQIFKTSLTLANTAKSIRLYGGPELARRRIRKAVEHKVDIERALLFQGGGVEGIHWGEIPVEGFENPLTRFKGLGIGAAAADPELVGWIVTKNADIDPAFVFQPSTADYGALGDLTDAIFDDTIDSPSSVKTVYAGNKWFGALAKMAMNTDANGNFVFGWRNQGTNSLGIEINELTSPHGRLRFVRMPHFRGMYEDYALVIDHNNIEVRPLRDTHMVADAGEKYIDGQLDFFLTEVGFECRHESTHCILKLR